MLERNIYPSISSELRKESYGVNRENFLFYKTKGIYDKILKGIAIAVGAVAIGSFGYLIYEGPIKGISNEIKNEIIAKQVPEIQKLDSVYYAKRDSMIQDYQKKHQLESKLK